MTQVMSGLIKPPNTINPNKGLYSQLPAVGNVLSSSFGTGAALSQQNQATAQSQKTASNLQNQLNARIAQGNLAHPLSQITGQGTQNSSIAPLNTRASVATPAQLQSGIIPVNGGGGNGNSPIVPPAPMSNNPAGGSTQAPTPPSPLAPNNNSFGGAVGTVMQTAASPTGNFSTAQNTANTSAQSLLNSTPAQNAAVVAAKQNIQDLQNAYADQTGLIGNSPIGLSEQGGEQGLLNSQYASKLGAAQTGLANVLQGNAQQQAAYTGAGNIANTEAGAATTQQQAQLGGQEAAAGLVAPTPANIYGQFNPATGLVTGYNSGTAENPSTSGVATGGAIQTQAQQGSAVQTMTGTLTQAQGLASTLSDAITSAGYNPVQGIGPATTFANGVNDWLQKNSGSPQYQNVANLISEVANKYAAILNQSGGTPTSVSQVQQQIINGLASGTQIKDILANLDTNAQTSINALKSASQTNAAQGSSGGSSSSGGWSSLGDQTNG